MFCVNFDESLLSGFFFLKKKKFDLSVPIPGMASLSTDFFLGSVVFSLNSFEALGSVEILMRCSCFCVGFDLLFRGGRWISLDLLTLFYVEMMQEVFSDYV